jgi:hypothetical protein
MNGPRLFRPKPVDAWEVISQCRECLQRVLDSEAANSPRMRPRSFLRQTLALVEEWMRLAKNEGDG